MIYTLTLNPALDYVIQVPEFVEGKVNRMTQEAICIGGKGINVSLLLDSLSMKSTCLGFIGGFTGQEIKRQLEVKEHVKTKFIEVKDGLTRINVKMTSHLESEMNGIGPHILSSDVDALLNQLSKVKKGDVLILSGSVPSMLPQSIYKDIMATLDGVDVVVDTTGDALKEVLEFHPFLIKPNHHELAEFFDVNLSTTDDIVFYAQELQKLGARNVLISMAKEGSILVSEEGQVYFQSVCQGTVVNSVGAGDSMVAGFVAGYLKGYDYEQTLKLATATGGATAFSEGIADYNTIMSCLKNITK